MLLERADDPKLHAWLAGLARVPDESVADEAVRLQTTLARWREQPFDFEAATVRRVGLSFEALIDSLDYIGMTYHQDICAALSPGLSRREDVLKGQALTILRDGGGKPTVFMAHALHLLKNDRLGGAASPAGPGGGQTSSVGHFLSTEQRLSVFSVWMIWGGGEDSQPFPDLPRRFACNRDTLNAALSTFDHPVIFPIGGAPSGVFDRPWSEAHMYNANAKAKLEGQVDAILYLPAVSPMRLTPLA